MASDAQPFLALLERILRTAGRYYVSGPTEGEVEDYRAVCRQNAEQWVDSDDERVGGFLWTCDTLGVDPEYVRRKFREARAAGGEQYDDAA